MISIHAHDGALTPDMPQTSYRNCWFNMVAPTPEEIKSVTRLAKLEQEFVEHALDMHECPRIESDDDCTMVVIRAPYVESKYGDARHSTIPIGIILSQENVATVCRISDNTISNLLLKTEKYLDDFRAEHYICYIVKEVSMLFMKHLKEISADIQELEHDLAETRSNEDLKLLLSLQKSVTYFHSALKTNDFIIDRIVRKGLGIGRISKLSFNEDEDDELDYALTETRQGIYMCKIFSEVLTSIASVYSSIISNSVNQIMKVLTSLTVIIMIPTFITSLYGMNIDLPFQHHASAFEIVSACGLGLTFSIVLVMKVFKVL